VEQRTHASIEKDEEGLSRCPIYWDGSHTLPDRYCRVCRSRCFRVYLEKRNDEYSHQFIIGNIFDGFDFDKKRIYDEYDGTDLLCDSNCVCIMDKCFRCISVNYMNKGSIFIMPKKGYCEFMKIDNYFQALAKSAIKNCRVENE